MSIQLDGIDQWREYFRTANADIFDIIERSIMVAASDRPNEFKLRRDRVAELLFSTRLARCTQCDRVGLSVPEPHEGGGGGGARVESDGPGGSKGSKTTSIRDDQKEVHVNQVSNYSYGDAEALTEEIEEEGLVLDEVLRIKEVLSNFEDESDSVLFELLRKLQLMRLTVSILKSTEIGKTVNGLRRHGVNQIRDLVRELIGEWKAIVDEFIQGGTDPAGHGEATPDSVNPSVVEDEEVEEEEEEEEEGLPSPPMDDCAFFTTGNIDFTQFFDGMDDDGNLRNSEEFNKNQEGGRKPFLVKPEQPSKEEGVMTKDDKVRQLKKHESVPKPSSKPVNPASGPGRPVKSNAEQRVNPSQMLQKNSDKPNVPRKPVMQSENIRRSTEDPVQEKIEATKRRLHERYQEAKDAKRQRTVQVVEIHDLPKQGHGQRHPKNKFGNPSRKWANAR